MAQIFHTLILGFAILVPHDDVAVERAVKMLGQAVNPVRVLGRPEIREIYSRTPGGGVPPDGLTAFRVPGDPNIYVNGESVVYQDAAKKPSTFTLLRLAATLLHEQVHNTDGDLAAYRLQADFVQSRLKDVPRRQQEQTKRYWQGLDARAVARARAQRICDRRYFLATPGPSDGSK